MTFTDSNPNTKSTNSFSPEDIQLMLDNLDNYSPEEQHELFKIVSELETQKRAEAARQDLIEFCKLMQPDYKVGKHHRILADLLMEIERGREYDIEGNPLTGTGKDRICVNMPPRHGKSQLVSIYFPAWFLGRNPEMKVLMVSHTTDLAVDFGRKVRNIIGSETYKQVFPDVELAKDSKSAGRWNTNVGGEYFACLRRFALVHTARGQVPAGQVRIGDYLRSTDGYVTVQEVYDSQHSATYNVAGLFCSAEHPIWTMNRGWVNAEDLVPEDVLCVESILDRIKALLGRVYGYLEHTYVSPVVQHKESVPQSKQRKVVQLWWARDYVVRALAHLRELFTGYGATTQSEAYSWAGGQRWTLQPGELPLGGRAPTTEQQKEQPLLGRAYIGSTFAGYGANLRGDSVPGQEWDTTECPTAEEEELRAYSNPKNLGWVRHTTTRFLAGCGQSHKTRGRGNCFEEYMARVGRATEKLCGFLLGVRRVGQVKITAHAEPKQFVNFLTDGHHAFFVDEVLTHNCGVGSALAGRGAHLLLVDDPHNEQDIINGNLDVFDKAYEWFTYGARTRLMPQGRVAIVQTRWAMDDLTGRLTRDMTQNHLADQYEVVEFPAILEVDTPDENNPKKTKIVEKPLWPEFFNLDALHRTKASMPVFQWNSQYQQQPTAEEGAIIKREWWQPWYPDRPPECEYIIMTLDAAAEATNRADFSAFTIWGVFHYEGGQYARELSKSGDSRDPGGFTYTKELLGVPDTYNIILLNAVKRRLEFPELKDLAWELYNEWAPDAFIVEKKSSGTPLYQELRRTGMLLQEYTPVRGTTNNPNNKTARLNSVADIVRSGLVWAPQTRWAEEVIEEVAGFPAMPNDDLVDTMIMALMRFRQGGFINLPTDEPEEERYFKQRRGGYY